MDHTLALTKSGDLYGWGLNSYGEQLDAPNQAPRASKLNLGERMYVPCTKIVLCSIYNAKHM